MDNLYDYYLHYNIYDKSWNAVKRDKVVAYWNGGLKKEEIIKSKDINTIISYITKLDATTEDQKEEKNSGIKG